MEKSKKIFSWISVQLPVVVLFLLILATSIVGYFYYKGPSTTKLTALLGGFVTGLTLAIIQFVLNWAEYRATSKVQSLGVKDILLHRDDRSLYQKLIEGADDKIYVMGVTAIRFMEHFADSSSDRKETKVLLEALGRETQVRILVPKPKFLASEDDKAKAKSAATYLKKTKKSHDNFEFRYFNHVPTHSIVVADKECIVGPVFPGVPSKHTPAIYIISDSEYSKKYLEYFETEWEKAKVENDN